MRKVKSFFLLFAGIAGIFFISCNLEEKSSNADLQTLTVSEGVLTPAFHRNISAYTVHVPGDVTVMTVTGTAADDKARVSYSPVNPVSLNAGAVTTISLVVAAEDDTAYKDYTVTVYSNMLKNCGFDEGLDDWDFWVSAASGAVAAADTFSGGFTLNIQSGANQEFSIGLAQVVSLMKNSNYLISFDASSTVEDYAISAGIQEWGTDADGDGSPYSNWNRKWFNLTTTMKNYSGVLIMSPGYDDPGAALLLGLDKILDSPVTLVIDNIRLTRIDSLPFTPPSAPEMIWNGDFSRDINFWWWWSANGTLVPDCSGGKFVLLNPDPGIPRGQMCIKSNKLNIISGNVYEIYVNASSTVAGEELELALSEAGVDIDGDGQNYTHLDSKTIQLTASDLDHVVTLSTIYSSINICLNIYFTGTRGTIGINSVSMKPVQ